LASQSIPTISSQKDIIPQKLTKLSACTLFLRPNPKILIMRNIFAALLVFAAVAANAQTGDKVKRPAIGVSFFLNDFKTADLIRSTSLSQVFRNDQFGVLRNMNPGLGVNYMAGISKTIDYNIGLGAYFIDYPIPGRALAGSESPALDLSATFRAKLLSDDYWVTPYLTAGIGATMYKSYFSGYLPLGGGLQVNLYDETFIMLGANYNTALTELSNYNFNYNLSVYSNIGAKEKPAEVVAVAPPVDKDTDGDGTMDGKDKCPTVAGSAKYDGCPIPDTDKDGINDDEDKCPTVTGLLKYNGCPIPDTDSDGINDEDDKCPTEAGVARYAGCPVPDTDKDGINDEEDKCPTEAGIASLQGCPEIKKEEIEKITYAAKNIYFATGSAKLLKKSFPNLDTVVMIMKGNDKIMLEIEGHTDSQGKEPKNVKLSDARAKAVMAYLKKKGIAAAKMSAKGFGSSVPVADNTTKEGRSQNRRVELKPKAAGN
jgi:OmpA-OmpF porin, OOP family